MRILHLISGGDIGGAKTHIESLLPNLNKIDGVSAELLCVMEGEMTRKCRELGVSVTVIPQNKRYDLSAVKKIARWIKSRENSADGGFDIIHCHGARANFIALLLRASVKTPMLTTLHSDYREDFRGGGYRRLIYTPLNVLSLKRFKHLITVSEVFRQMLIGRGFDANRIYVVHNGVSFLGARPLSAEEKLSRKLEFLREHDINLKDSVIMKEHAGERAEPPKAAEQTAAEIPVIIGSAIRLHPAKGADILLKAAKIFLDNGNDALFLIAGDGAMRPELERRISESAIGHRVRLLGFVKDIDRFYSILDIHVLPSVSEGFAIVLLEGARHRLNTVASAVGGVPEVICAKSPYLGDKNLRGIEHGNGILFKPGDAAQLADILAHEVNHPQNGIQRGIRLYEDVKERFSDVSMARNHVKVYKEVLIKK